MSSKSVEIVSLKFSSAQKPILDSKNVAMQNLEIALSHREKRMEKENELLKMRIQKLVSELENADGKWLEINKENLGKISSLQSTIADLRDKLNAKVQML